MCPSCAGTRSRHAPGWPRPQKPGRSRSAPSTASAALVQAIFADDYHGRTVTFRGQLRTTGIVGQAGLHLAVSGPLPEAIATRPLLGHGSSPTAPGSCDWTWHGVTVPVPGEATAIMFGISLTGRGRIELRGADLTPARPEAGE